MKNSRYPRGKLNDTDEGASTTEVFLDQNTVIVNFNKELTWIGLDRKQALEFARILIKLAEQTDVLQ